VSTPEQSATPVEVTFRAALVVWLKIGLLSFGGPAGQIALMHRILVEEKRWIGEERFLHALNYCMLLPGPEAQQLACYVGWLLHRTWGGIVAGRGSWWCWRSVSSTSPRTMRRWWRRCSMA
jgi:chromate transporter